MGVSFHCQRRRGALLGLWWLFMGIVGENEKASGICRRPFAVSAGLPRVWQGG